MLVNKMIRSGLVIQSNGLFGGYPSNHNPQGRWGSEFTDHPSTLPNQFDTGFQTTKTISPFQQTVEIERAIPGSVFRHSKSNRFYRAQKGSVVNLKNINGPRSVEPMYDDVFGKKANELVDYVQGKIKTNGSFSTQGESQVGSEGIIGNAPNDKKVKLMVDEQLSTFPRYIQNIAKQKIGSLPPFVQADILGQIVDLPRLIETNSIGYTDVESIIDLIIQESSPRKNDIFTNQTTITEVPQQTENGTVYVSIPNHTFGGSSSAQGVVSDIDILREQIRQIRRKKRMTETDLDTIDELENEIKTLMSLVNATKEYLNE
jgi:hypothetical protein